MDKVGSSCGIDRRSTETAGAGDEGITGRVKRLLLTETTGDVGRLGVFICVDYREGGGNSSAGGTDDDAGGLVGSY
jgi:hypothetical protein